MLILRVRCADDGRELLLERHGADAHHIQVAQLKSLVLRQRRHLTRSGDASSQSDDLGACFVLLRGRILADADVLDLNALSPSDFFVFAPDAPQSGVDWSSSSEMQSGDAIFDVLRSQLEEMGFSKSLAAQALQQSGNNLSEAVALLAEGKMHRSLGDEGEEKASRVHPSIAPLGSLVHDANVVKLRELTAKDSFRALLLLKEQFPADVLNQLNENPVATLRLLSLPAPAMKGFSCDEVIDVDSESGVATTEDSDTAIDRLVALGFTRDLVQVMYESCDGNEQLTANALLQTLES